MTRLAFIPQAGRFSTPVQSHRPQLCASRPVCMSATVPFRVGHGFDLHRLEPGLPLILGGVRLQHERGCAGHSDGDAIYHCVVDAILGALALPDIGQLFPDSDPKFKNCPSNVFMDAAFKEMRDAGFRVGNIDITVILERPKMAPHKRRMRENIAELLHTSLDNVNVKAKTHEKVDAVGENRAVSVHAVATLVEDGAPTNEAVREAEAYVSSTVKEGSNVTDSLLGMVEKRASDIQELTTPKAPPEPPLTPPPPPTPSPPDTAPTACAVQKLYDTVVSRKGGDPSSSWTAKLFSKGRKKIAEKVGEEAVEVVIDAVAGNREAVVKESADLLYHLNVLWADMNVAPKDVWDELASREATSGIAEKAARST